MAFEANLRSWLAVESFDRSQVRHHSTPSTTHRLRTVATTTRLRTALSQVYYLVFRRNTQARNTLQQKLQAKQSKVTQHPHRCQHDVHESHFLRYQVSPNDPQHTHQVKGWTYSLLSLVLLFSKLTLGAARVHRNSFGLVCFHRSCCPSCEHCAFGLRVGISLRSNAVMSLSSWMVNETNGKHKSVVGGKQYKQRR